MTLSPLFRTATRTAQLLHGALCIGALVIAVVLSVLRSTKPVYPGAPILLLRYISLGVLVVDLVAAHTFRGRIPPLAPGDNVDAWWEAQLPRALVVWALLESAVLFGAVVHFAVGDWVPLAAAGVALVVLWNARPARLAE